MPARDPDIRSTVATIAVEQSWFNTADRAARTGPARANSPGELAYWERQLPHDLDPAEKARRAEHARRAHFLRPSLKAKQARSAKRGDAA